MLSEVTFPRSVPSYCAASLTLSCPPPSTARRPNARSAEALEDHFGARSPREKI